LFVGGGIELAVNDNCEILVSGCCIVLYIVIVVAIGVVVVVLVVAVVVVVDGRFV